MRNVVLHHRVFLPKTDLIVRPAGLPHAQGLGVGELSFEAEQDPAVAEEQLEAVLPQPGQVLVEARQHETQQLAQVHLEAVQKAHASSHKTQIDRFLVRFCSVTGKWCFSGSGFANAHKWLGRI